MQNLSDTEWREFIDQGNAIENKKVCPNCGGHHIIVLVNDKPSNGKDYCLNCGNWESFSGKYTGPFGSEPKPIMDYFKFVPTAPTTTEISKPELKPCPFCGGDWQTNTKTGQNAFYVVCHNCGARGGLINAIIGPRGIQYPMDDEAGDGASAKWNRRAGFTEKDQIAANLAEVMALSVKDSESVETVMKKIAAVLVKKAFNPKDDDPRCEWERTGPTEFGQREFRADCGRDFVLSRGLDNWSHNYKYCPQCGRQIGMKA